VSPRARTRGLDYFREGRAKVVSSDGESVEYAVRGTRRYAVVLSIEKDVLYCACTCPFFVDRQEVCKHVWAAILDCERSRVLAGEAGVFALQPDPLANEAEAMDDGEPGPFRVEGSPGGRPEWLQLMRRLASPRPDASHLPALDWTRSEIRYAIHLSTALKRGTLVVELKRRDRKKDDTWGAEKVLSIDFGDAERLPDARDRRVFALLRGSETREWGHSMSRGYENVGNPAVLSKEMIPLLLPALAATGRCFVRASHGDDEGRLLRCDFDPPWRTVLEIVADDRSPQWVLNGAMEREGLKLAIADVDLFLSSGHFFQNGVAGRIESDAAFPVIALLREHGKIVAPADDGLRLVAHTLEFVSGAEVKVPDTLRFDEAAVAPVPTVRIRRQRRGGQNPSLDVELSFRYDAIEIDAFDARTKILDEVKRLILPRDQAAESAARDRLVRLGFRFRGPADVDGSWQLPPALLPKAVPALVALGWQVEAEGTVYRQASSSRLRVVSGEDWFELQGGASFNGVEVPLPQLLAAARKGEGFVKLGDGSLGILPEAWLEKVAPLAGLGHAGGGAVRFSQHQAGLLEALLIALPETATDELFDNARRKLASFEGIAPLSEPPGFRGELRGYQRDGLGWFRFLREFGFGGCLADDMGLGKTVQVLALLASREKERGDAPRASLVVAPRSVVFNWIDEAKRFAPKLRTLDYTGIGRSAADLGSGKHELVLTTYGTLRRDAAALSKIPFDYVILDESQAIKNASSQAAKAARLLSGRHRLALSGTPIENHLGELWSLFEFLNPGMLGKSPAFRTWTAGAGDADDASRIALARAVKPFVLRRTKEKVTPELPARTEQTLWCDLGPVQRRLYDQLRDHYRASLLAQVNRDGLAKSKIHVLEALLRLRQAACHPGLIDKARSGMESAKLDLLVERVAEVVDEGHKVLVFSQFTSLLALLQPRLGALGPIGTAYLDGATPAKERAEAVARFQDDENCRLFLLSLKAGGVGLNLTAAGYVFLLDPWWNPAVEAQAIDRAHRIGQSKPVIAYRLVARDTVEERILSLQEKKRALADSILAGDESLLRTLTREDLEALLG
jgi:superfamily II DNA or RNA helicase